MKYTIRKILSFFGILFKHNCENHKELISSGYIKCGSSGLIFSTGKDYKCKKCQNRWTESSNYSPNRDKGIDYFDVLKKSLPYF